MQIKDYFCDELYNMKMKYFALFLIGTVMLAGCSHTSINQRLDIYESDIDESPNETYEILQKLQQQQLSLTHQEQNRLDFLTLKAKYCAYKVMTINDSIMINKVIDYFQDHSYSSYLQYAYYIQGGIYRSLGDASKAVESYNEAVGVADTNSNNCNYPLLARIYLQKSSLESSQALFENAVQSAQQALYYSIKGCDVSYEIDCRLYNIALHNLKKDFKPLLEESFPLVLRSLEIDSFVATKETVGFAWYFLQLSMPLEARQMVSLFERYSGQVDVKRGTSTFPMYYGVKGKCLLAEHKLDSAEYFFRKEMEERDWNNRQTAYRGLKELYEMAGQKDSALKYATLQCEAVDSDYQHKITAEVQRLQTAYNYSRYREGLYQSQLTISQQRLMIAISVAVVLLLMVLVAVGVGSYRKYKQHSIEQQALLQAQIKEQTAEMESQQQALEDMQDQLETYKDIKERLLDKDDAHKLIERCIKTLRSPSADEWNLLEAFVVHSYPNFLPHLLELVGKLNETERQTVILIKLGVPKGNIPQLIARSSSAVANIRRRLYEKALGEQPASMDVADTWLESL